MKDSFKFVNVDLELRSATSPTLVIREFGSSVHVLYNGPVTEKSDSHLTSFEIEKGKQPEEKIALFCSLIEQFPKSVRSEWDACHSRRFDIGLQSGILEKAWATLIPLNLIERCAILKCEVAFTIYPNHLDGP